MIRVAVIGTGNISTAHIEGYLAFPERCQIVALCDIFPEKAQAKKEKYQLNGADVVDDHEKLLDREDIDLVSVCTPPYCHASIAIHFLQHGKNVLVEKPMATSLQECDEMIAMAKEHGKVLGVIAQNRFRDPIMKLKKVLDSGLTGRKLIVDTYGGYAHHGGGAFSGKDSSKVDRSAAYMARYIAKNVVAAGLADRCEVQLSYAIGVAQPVSVLVDTFGTEKVAREKIQELVSAVDMRPAAIIKRFDLRAPNFSKVSCYGHFGENAKDMPWEKTDLAESWKNA